MSYCGECYYQGKKLKPCSTCWCGSEAKTECTNADKIRNMDDAELAEFISSLVRNADDYMTSEGNWLIWLQSKAE